MSVQVSQAMVKPATPPRTAVLIVEDEFILAKDLQRTLIDLGYDAYAIASSAEAAMKRADERRPDLVMMDIRIKGPLDGIQTAMILKRQYSTAIIFLTAHADEAMIERAKETEPDGYMLKPVNPAELRTILEIGRYKHQLGLARAEKAESERRLQASFTEMTRAVHESDENFRMMVDAVKDYAIFMLDVDGRIASWNLGAERLKGYSKPEIVGEHFSKFYTLDDIAAHRPEQNLEIAASLGRSEDLGWRVRKDGTQFFADVVITAVYDSDGRLRGFAKVTQDVTARKSAERRLHETSSLLRTVLDSASSTSIIATDPSFTIKVFNTGAERLLGYTSEEIVDCATIMLLHDPEELRLCGDEFGAHLGGAIGSGQIFHLPSMHGRSREWIYVRKDGGRVAVDLVVTPMQTCEGELLGYVSVAQDVTQQKQYEESLRRATLNAEKANTAKSLFLANMSHEIRTPMHAVIGLTYLLEQTPLSLEQAALVAQINLASQALLSVITDVLDISKIEAGELLISRVAFSPRALLNGLLAIMRAQADLKGITLTVDLPDELPAALEGDAARLNQILTNLLSNAIKFTERGGVSLCVRVNGSTSTASTLSFTVRDTGIGIDTAAQARLFTPFIQADESITRRYGGTGLGLSIIFSLAKLMGGTVDFTSTIGVGSEFRVILEFTLATVESLAATQPGLVSRGEHPLLGVRVLVVDDYELNLVVTRRILEQAGALVWVANNGQEAFDQLRLEPAQFDIVLMDVQMPTLDGYEATRRIRTELGLMKLPIVALTAGALSSERQRAIAVGMDDFIIKPFDAATLISSVIRHIGRVGTPGDGMHSPPRTADGAVEWPEIAGIDTQSARSRWCGDLPLFRSMLEGCLDKFADIAGPSRGGSTQGLDFQAARFHKLTGGAYMLGASAIGRLAAEAEAACLSGDAALVAVRSIELVTHLDALRSSAARAFEVARFGEAPMAAPSVIELEPLAVAARVRIVAPPRTPGRVESEGPCRVLLVDDDELVRAHVANLLERSGYRVGEAASGEEALRALRGGDYRIVIMDWTMPGMSGIELCRALRANSEHRDLYVMMLSMMDRPQDVDLSYVAGADAYVLKGASNEEIIERMATAQHIARLRSSSRETEVV